MTPEPVPRTRATVLIGLLVAALSLVTAAPAAAAPRITVSTSSGLNPAGDRITVSGTGYDETKGIYVAICVDNGPGQVPTPCLGGADTGGAAGGSAWISSNPPSYGAGLAQPYGPGGSFTVTLAVVARDPVTGTDCTKVACAAVTRADHTRTADRSQDARVPLNFATPPAPAPVATMTAPPPPAPAVQTTTAVPATTTTTTSTTSTSPPVSASSQPAVARTAAPADGGGPGAGWWLSGVAAVLLGAGAVFGLRWRRRQRPAEPAD